MGIYSVSDSAYIKILETIDRPNTDINSCGYEAYQAVTDTTMTLDDYRKVTGDTDNFCLTSFLTVAEIEKINIAVFTP